MSADSVVRTLAADGFAHISLSGDPNEDRPVLERHLRDLGRPIHVFLRQPFWKPMKSDPARPPGRSGGVGFNSLHIDCVNVEMPPDILVLYCIQRDPRGGGDNLVAVTDGLERVLAEPTLNLLATTPVSEGAAYDLDEVGDDLNAFYVYSAERRWPWRYSGRMLTSSIRQQKADFVEALLELDQALLHRAQAIALAPGDALFIDQRRTLHGRLPLGLGQDELPAARRRVLVQAFARAIDA